MKLSLKAWERSLPIYEAIIKHPFNQELMLGTLKLDKFSFYIEQDGLYLQDFSRCLAIIASKIALPKVRTFLHYADYALIEEQSVVHEFFEEKFDFKETGIISPATTSYTSYLLRTCALESVEVAVSAILPCFWIYREVGLFIQKHSGSNNPFARWIETYSSKDFVASVDEVIGIFDDLAVDAGDAIRQKMLDVFYNSTCLEWHFWNDAYNKTSLIPIN